MAMKFISTLLIMAMKFISTWLIMAMKFIGTSLILAMKRWITKVCYVKVYLLDGYIKCQLTAYFYTCYHI